MPVEPLLETMAQRIKALEKSENQLQEIVSGLREKEEHLRFLAEEILLPIVIVQEDRIAYANRAYANLTGYSLKEIGQSIPSAPPTAAAAWMKSRESAFSIPFLQRNFRVADLAWLRPMASSGIMMDEYP